MLSLTLSARPKGKAVAAGLTAAIGVIVKDEGTCLIAFHKNARPDVLHHTLEPAGRKHYLERYLDGPYLLDPLYQLALRCKKPGLVPIPRRITGSFPLERILPSVL